MVRLAAAGRLIVGLLLVAWASASVRAQSTSAEELAFWQSVSQSDNPAELREYLRAYPHGAFVALARLRLGPDHVLDQGQVAGPTALSPIARVTPTRPSFRLVEGVTLDLDASGVRNASNLRLVVVPASSPVEVADPDQLVLDSTAVTGMHLRLTIPAGIPGADEVRLYYIPNSGTNYLLAASAPVTVEPGTPGATLVRDLGREAAQLGPVRFEANHRNRPMLIQGAFLRLRPRTDWNVYWFGGRSLEQLGRQVVVLSIGRPNATADLYGSMGEAVCVVDATDASTLDYVSSMKIGDPVVVSAIPTSWGNARPTDPIVLDRCALRPRSS